MAATDLAIVPKAAPRRRSWPYGAAILGAVLTALALVAAMHARAASPDTPQRITVAGREYRGPVQVAATSATGGSGTWSQVGTLPSDGSPVYAVQISGAAPTAVFVPSPNGEYTEYTLVGGP